MVMTRCFLSVHDFDVFYKYVSIGTPLAYSIFAREVDGVVSDRDSGM